jgi:hypothetical protein
MGIVSIISALPGVDNDNLVALQQLCHTAALHCPGKTVLKGGKHPQTFPQKNSGDFFLFVSQIRIVTGAPVLYNGENKEVRLAL